MPIIIHCETKSNCQGAGIGLLKNDTQEDFFSKRKEDDNIYVGWRLLNGKATCGWCISYLLAHKKIEKIDLLNYKTIIE
jgi:hypothetical protein